MKRTYRILSLLLALVLTLSLFTACSKKSSKQYSEQPGQTDAPASAGIKGETVSDHGWSVLVPEGFQLQEPSDISYYDFAVTKSSFYYFYFITEDDNERIQKDYEYNKNTYTNEQEDVEATYGANTWTGFQYSDGFGGYGFEVCAQFGEKLIRVSSCGFRFDSEEAKAVLASLAKE